MVQYFILIVLMLSSFTLSSQEKSDFPCNELEVHDTLQIIAPGNIDHTELDISWISEEVTPSNFSQWSATWMKKHFLTNDPSIDSIQQDLFKEEMDRLKVNWKEIQAQLKKGDRVFYYSTPHNYWDTLRGQDGLLVIRDCYIVKNFILMQS